MVIKYLVRFLKIHFFNIVIVDNFFYNDITFKSRSEAGLILIQNIIQFIQNWIRKAAKKYFFSGRTTKRERGKAVPTK